MASQANQSNSFWIPEGTSPVFGPVSGTTEADVVVVGGGIAGLTTALSLIRAGRNVMVLEQDRIGCGSTGRATAKLSALHRLVYAKLEKDLGRETAEVYAAANQAGIEHVASLVEELNIDCGFERRDAFTFTCEPRMVEDLHREVDAARRAGLPASLESETDLPFTVEAAVRVSNQAQFDPYRFCRRLAQAIIDEGGQIHEETRATDVRRDHPCVVKTERGDDHCRRVVLATLIPFMDQGGFFVRAYPSRAYAVAARLTDQAPRGMYISAESPIRSVRAFPDESGVIVAGEAHKVGQDPDTRARFSALEAWARRRFDVEEITHRWSSQDYVSADGLPFIGNLPFAGGEIAVVTGLNRWGLAMSAAAAMILTDAIQGKEHPWSSVFNPNRANVLASAKKFVCENTNVAKRFVGDRLKAIATKPIRELVNGEAGIVSDDGKRVAAYRDDTGVIHAVSPVCTHMGCYLQWNTAEKTWDCPCHGSRFDYKGGVLQGPAVKDLSQRRITRRT